MNKIKFLNVIPNIKDYEPYVIYLYDNKDAVNNFIFLSYNRDIRNAHVNKMYKKLKGKESLSSDFSPIKVDIKDYAILDGQNRFKAFCKCWDEGIKAELKVEFVDIPFERRVEYLKNINTNSKNWSLEDYAKMLKNKDEVTYNKILSFALKNKYCHSNLNKIKWRYTFQFLFGTNKTKELQDFNLKVYPKDLKKAQQLHDEIEKLFENIEIKMGAWFEHFVGAYRIIREDKDFKDSINTYGFKKFVDCFSVADIEYRTDIEYYKTLLLKTAIRTEYV